MINILCISATLIIYSFSSYLYRKKPVPFLIPVLTTTFILILLLLAAHIPYQMYFSGSHWISNLLGPAVVALAYPLYLYKDILKQNIFPILSGVGLGFLAGFLFIVCFDRYTGGWNQSVLYSLYPKSVTTPVAMEIAKKIGGSASLASVFVMITGIGGTIIAPLLFRFKIFERSAAKGIALGTSSHAIGTSKAMEYGEEEAAFSSVSMGISCVLASVFIPLFVMFMK